MPRYLSWEVHFPIIIWLVELMNVIQETCLPHYIMNIDFSNSCSIFTLLNPCEKKSIINVWITLFNYAIMSQPVGEIRISRYISRKNVTFRKMSLCQ